MGVDLNGALSAGKLKLKQANGPLRLGRANGGLEEGHRIPWIVEI